MITINIYLYKSHSLIAAEETPTAANPPPPAMASKKQAPAPETLDAKYIADVLGAPLTAALAEVAEKRPWDPIEYLAQWLYKHKANLNFHQAVSVIQTLCKLFDDNLDNLPKLLSSEMLFLCWCISSI